MVPRLTVWRPLAVTLAVTALAGCSSSNELRTPGQATRFVAEVARGEPSAQWRLASDASPQAAQAWADKAAIGDLGRRLRSEHASWTCELTKKLVALGSIGTTGSFDDNDLVIVMRQSAKAGAGPDRISAMIQDVRAVRFSELTQVSRIICGSPTS